MESGTLQIKLRFILVNTVFTLILSSVFMIIAMKLVVGGYNGQFLSQENFYFALKFSVVIGAIISFINAVILMVRSTKLFIVITYLITFLLSLFMGIAFYAFLEGILSV